MNKKLKIVLICIISLSLLTILVLISKINSRIPENPSDYAGNTAGNLYNRGLFLEDDNYIYFSNLADNNRLYRMDKSLENIKCLHKDSVEFLNFDSESRFLYYSRTNYRLNNQGTTAFDLLSSGIYRLDLKKSNVSRLFEDPCGTVLLAGNELFFQVHGQDGSFDLYSLPTGEKKPKTSLVTTDYITPVSYHDGLLFFSGVKNDHYLYSLSPSEGTSRIYAKLDCYLPIVTDEGVYFLSQKHNYSLFFLPDKEDEALLISDERISSYNISSDGNYVFYQIDNGKSNCLCRYDINSKTESVLISGNFSNLNTVSDYLFFTDFEKKNCYCYDIKEDTVFSFMPKSKN